MKEMISSFWVHILIWIWIFKYSLLEDQYTLNFSVFEFDNRFRCIYKGKNVNLELEYRICLNAQVLVFMR